MPPSPALLVAIPLIAAAFLSGLRKFLPRWLADSVSILVALTNLWISALWLKAALGRTTVYWFGDWFPRGKMALGIGFVIDPAGAGLAVVAALLASLALLFSWKFVESGENHSQPLMLVFLAAMSGFALTGDIFNLFVFFELMSTAAFALCGLKSGEPAPLVGAFNFAVTNTVAAFMMLTGIAFIYSATGALNMAQIGVAIGHRHDPLVLGAFTFIACGFLIKAAAVPFHFWLADAHAVAPTPVCVLFSGLMVELGLFGVMRVYSTMFHQSFVGLPLHMTFIALGALTACFGAIMCFAEHHLKRLLAFSTISHTGLMVMAFGVWTKEALAGLFLYLLAHALVKSGLFFLTGILLHRLRSMSEPKLHGCGKELHWTAVLWFLGGLGLAGAPGFLTMAGEVHVTGQAEWSEWIFLISGALTGAAVLRAGLRIFFGWGDPGPVDKLAKVDELPETTEENRKINWFLFFPAAACVLGAIAVTFVPVFARIAASAAARLMDFSEYAAAVYGSAASKALPAAPPMHIGEAAVHGGITAFVAIVIAFWAVFHLQVPRGFRWPSHMEGPLRGLREVQSGHPGDYVAWIVFGTAVIGGAFFALAR